MELLGQLKKMKLKDWYFLLILLFSFIPGKIWKIISRNIWVISEYETLARDNGYWLFKYIRENYPQKKVYYPIKKDSIDYKRIEMLGNIVEFGSFKHYLLFWAADIYIGTTKCSGFPYRRICEDLVQWNLHGFKYVFLNHGFTRGYSSIVNAAQTNYDLLFTCSEKDSEIIIQENKQNSDVVKCVGYPRHDTLYNSDIDRKQILIMPTWRKWIDYRLLSKHSELEDNLNHFMNSSYYLNYQNLLNHEGLIRFLEENDLKIVFYFHEYAQEYSKYMDTSSDRIIIGTNDNYFIQDLLKSSSLLITDYSSVCYDFAYMYKPVLYFQFDLCEFEEKQYAQGERFSYERDGFGEICYSVDNLVSAIKRQYKSGFEMETVYRNRADVFFKYHDTKNCERVYTEIQKLGKGMSE